MQATIVPSKTRTSMTLFFLDIEHPLESFRGWLQARFFFSLDVHIQVWYLHAAVRAFQFVACHYSH
jgi:hypothetical protein